MKISLVVAMSQNRVIGKNNRLPWHLPEDLKRFRAITLNKPVVMGRKTFDSIGRILPQRENIIVSRQVSLEIPGARVFASLEQALDDCEKKETPEVMIIGGGEIYRLAFEKADRIYLTLIHQSLEGDAFFPDPFTAGFVVKERQDFSEPMPHSFLVMEKIYST